MCIYVNWGTFRALARGSSYFFADPLKCRVLLAYGFQIVVMFIGIDTINYDDSLYLLKYAEI